MGAASVENHPVTLESHSIDFVPLAERYGTPRRLFTVWFSANMTILGVALGTFGVTAGLSLANTFLALAIGNAVGTAFMAAHSAQGPQLGVPQMIQSRAQFGLIGAGLPLIAVVVTYLLYCAANSVLIEGPIAALLPIGDVGAFVLFALVTLLIAFVGYELIHKIGAVLTVTSTVLFLLATYLLLVKHHGHIEWVSSLSTRPSSAAFALTITQAAAWGLSYGPYVADYSRYLPPSVPSSRTFWYTAAGCFLSGMLIMSFGACLALLEPGMAKDPGSAVASLFGPAHGIIQLLIIIGVVQGNVMNLYSAYMSTVTIFSGVRGMNRISRGRKLFVMAALMTVATVIAIWARDDFQTYFADALSAMVYLLIPWSAINLADYYVVHKGRYDIGDLFRIDGRYGAYRWRTIGVYFFGIAAQVPFMSLSLYKGPFAQWLGADLAWLPGLVFPGLLHIMVERWGNALEPSLRPRGRGL